MYINVDKYVYIEILFKLSKLNAMYYVLNPYERCIFEENKVLK